MLPMKRNDWLADQSNTNCRSALYFSDAAASVARLLRGHFRVKLILKIEESVPPREKGEELCDYLQIRTD